MNIAGLILYKPLTDTTDEGFDRLMAVNVRRTFLCCRQAARRLADGGYI